ncbi:MAG: N-acetylglucosaminyltransferase [Bacteroidota bacterium]|nr:N-acetylglucosaminyltransferase [Bacteroidota bacterium]
MKTYDCFSFFNELDLLEIRLHTLDKVVDQFVLVEATRTFQQKPKPLYYYENKERFKAFHHKITHIIVDKYPNFFYRFRNPTPWDYDTWQKNKAAEGLKNCQPDDVILFSDIDEIPNPSQLHAFKSKPGTKTFEQKHFYYYLNCVEVEPNNANAYKWWYGSAMTFFKHFTDIHELRFRRDIIKYKDTIVIPDGGWHFAYLGGVEKIIQKIESYAHTEHNIEDFKNPDRIRQVITSGKSLYGDNMQCKFVPIDGSFPEYIQNNLSKFNPHIFN